MTSHSQQISDINPDPKRIEKPTVPQIEPVVPPKPEPKAEPKPTEKRAEPKI